MLARLIYDLALPGVEDALGALARCEGVAAQELTPERCRAYEVLVIRSVTRIDADFARGLRGGQLRIIATATSGEDHVDAEALAEAGVAFASAKGCNADAVAQWVMWALARLRLARSVEVTQRVGVVGFGHTGRRVARCLHRLGVPVIACDPAVRSTLGAGSDAVPLRGPSTPQLDALTQQVEWASLPELLTRCSAVSLHVPLLRSGPHATRRLIDIDQLTSPVIAWCNAARGEVLNEAALLDLQQHVSGPPPVAALDVWTGEPAVDPRWLDCPAQIPVATPHIAGHTVEAKARALTLLHDPIAIALERGGFGGHGNGGVQSPITPQASCSTEGTMMPSRVVFVEADAGAVPHSHARLRSGAGASAEEPRKPSRAHLQATELDCIRTAVWRMLASDPELSALEEALRASVSSGQTASTFHQLRSALPRRREWSALNVEIKVSGFATERAHLVVAQTRTLVEELGFRRAAEG